MNDKIIFSPISLDEFEERIAQLVKAQVNIQIATPKVQDDDFITAKQTAKFLGVSLVSIHNWKKKGLIKYYRFGSRIRFKKSEILSSHRAGIK